MTRRELYLVMQRRLSHLTVEDCAVVVKTIMLALSSALVEGRRIEIRGFGSFSLAHQAARRARNPKSGAPLSVPAKRRVRFRPSKELRQDL